ncbi:LemA family protein [candidate division KSB1 bacterium]
MSAKKIIIGVLVVLVIFIIWIGGNIKSSYNDLVVLDEDTQTAWAQVETVLQRRYDLIPNLIETVKGFAQQEREVLTQVTEARSRVGQAQTPEQQITANNQLSGALGRLLLVVERYPELKSNQNFIRLQDELAGTENRIAVERRRYNEAVGVFNQKTRSFPTVVIAGMFGFSPKTRFEADTGAENAPRVDFIR